MANPDRQAKPDIHRTVQGVQNLGFDEAYQAPAVELLIENSAQNALIRLNEDNFGGSGVAAYSDSGGTDRKGLVDADRHVQVDVVGALPAGTNAIGKLSANSGVDIGDVDVTSSVNTSLDHGSNRDIDTTAEQITSTSFAAKFGVTVKADITNTGIVYIGNSDVTAGTTAATDGFPLSAGETLTLEVNNPNLLYAIASTNNQIIYWVAN